MSKDQSFKAYKRNDLKVVYSLKLDGEEKFSKKKNNFKNPQVR